MKKANNQKNQSIECPICANGRTLNRLSTNRFFCTICLNEFLIKSNNMYLIDIDEYTGDATEKLITPQ